MSLTLEEQVKAFQAEPWRRRLPGVSADLVSDLWKEIQRLRQEPMEDGTGYYDLVREISRLNAHITKQDDMLDARDDLLAKRRTELERTRSDAANVVRALDAAVQYAETLLAFLAEEGAPLHPNVVGAWAALQEALTTIGVRKP